MKAWDVMEPRARQTDPETSHEAARTVRHIGEAHQAILAVFALWPGMTDDDLICRYHSYPPAPRQSDSGLRTRRSELVKLGKVEDSGERRTLPTGRKAIVWRVKA